MTCKWRNLADTSMTRTPTPHAPWWEVLKGPEHPCSHQQRVLRAWSWGSTEWTQRRVVPQNTMSVPNASHSLPQGSGPARKQGKLWGAWRACLYCTKVLQACWFFSFGGLYRGYWASPGGASGKEPDCQCRRHETWFHPWFGRIPRRRAWKLIPGFLPGESHGQRSLMGYNIKQHSCDGQWTFVHGFLSEGLPRRWMKMGMWLPRGYSG